MKRSTHTTFPRALALLALLAACSSGGGGGGVPLTVVAETEPNGTTAEADVLTLGRPAQGGVADAGDSDFWRVALTANQLVSIEVFGNRFDFEGWTTSGNAPSVRLFDTDGTTLLLLQNDEFFSWNGDQDTDVLTFRVPASGTYFVAVDVADAAAGGGEYLLAVKPTALAAPLQLELEPEGTSGANDTDATAEAIAPGAVHGFHVDDEVDWYMFDVATPSLMTFTMHAHRNGVWKGDDDYYDAFVTLRDSALNPLDANDDTFYLDSSLNFVLTSPGIYYLEVDECCAAGDAGYFFELGLDALADLAPVAEVEPNDDTLTAQDVPFGAFLQGSITNGTEDVYAFACNAGDRVNVQAFDVSNLQGATATITCSIEDALAATISSDFGGNLRILRTILTSTGTFFVRVTSTGTTDYALRVTQQPSGFESEPNDDLASAGTFDANGRAAGLIAVLDDADTFAFGATANVPVRFEVLADEYGPGGFFELDGFGSTMQPELNVFDAASTLLTAVRSGAGTAVGVKDGLATVSLVFVPPATGTYYVQVTDEGSAFGTDAYYVLSKR